MYQVRHFIAYWCLLYGTLKLITCTGSCAAGWMKFEDSCYFISSESEVWILAEGSCRAHNARLAEVTTKEQDDFLRGVISDIDHKLWLGGRDDIKEGSWQWASTSEMFNYTNWAEREPDNHHNEDCLLYDQNKNHTWNDRPCTETHRYICEKRVHGVIIPEIIGK